MRARLERVPDPRSRRGRRYPLLSVLLICSCAVVSGARPLEEIAGWGQCAAVGLLARRAVPPLRPLPYTSHPTLTRILSADDGDTARDRLAEPRHSPVRRGPGIRGHVHACKSMASGRTNVHVGRHSRYWRVLALSAICVTGGRFPPPLFMLCCS
ncbi:transposase family protein [Streptomyces lanatus]|uniref:Transposase family protein n=1 Tax=Streptomyces lanatus TaxID=66900 RepID=A0ABV1XLS2_9ACTN